MHTIIGAFDDRATADHAVQRLLDTGIDRSAVHVEQDDSAVTSASTTSDPTFRSDETSGRSERGMFSGFFASLFGEDDTRRDMNTHYSEAVRRGSSVVVVDAQDETQADRAASVLNECGAIDVDERAQQWRASGWNPGQGAASGERQDATSRDRVPDQDIQRREALKDNQQGVLNVVQEELKVGKRTLDRGGVRVIQRVSEKPVSEILRLREEHATVDRQAVDREATAEDLSNFREGTLEVRETVEEPVVSKKARVVEEVRVGKEVREREETIEDTVRRRDVDVERLSEDRERAVASDNLTGEPPLAGRDASGTASGARKRKTTGKDKPTL